MSIRATCSKCGKTVKAGDDWAGRSGSCPGCGWSITFDAAPPSSPPPPPPPSETRSDDALNEELKRWEADAELPLAAVPAKHVQQTESAAKRCPTRPIFSTSVGAAVCYVLAALMTIGAFMVQAVARSAIHEIEAGVSLIVAALLFACGLLCSVHNTMRDVAHYQADLTRELAADLRSDLAQLQAELEWQRTVKEKEIVRAKAAGRASRIDQS